MPKIRPPMKLENAVRKIRESISDARREAYLGKYTGVIAGTRTNFIWVTDQFGNEMEVFNDILPVNKWGFGLGVWISRIEKSQMWQIDGIKNVYDDPVSRGVIEHADPDHTAYGTNPVWVWGDQFMPWMISPVNLTLKIYRMGYWSTSTGAWVDATIETLNLAASVPASGARYVLVEVGADGVIVATNSTPVASKDVLAITDIPAPTFGRLLLCAVRMYAGQTKILKNKNVKDLLDLRFSQANFGAGGVKPVSPSVVDDIVTFTDTVGGQKDGGHKIADLLHADGSVTANYIPYNIGLANPAWAEGRTFYDRDEHAWSYYNDESEVTENPGRELLVRVKNESGATIPNGTMVYPSGVTADGNIAIGIADARYREKCMVYGMTTMDIPNNHTGYVARDGPVHFLNTSALTGGIVYLKADGSGDVTSNVTDVTSVPGAFISVAGSVQVVSATVGIINVRGLPSQLSVDINNKSGFTPAQVAVTTLSFVDGTRIFSIAPTGADFYYYCAGVKYFSTSAKTIAISVDEGIHAIYFDGAALAEIVNPTEADIKNLLTSKCIVANVYWDATNSAQIYLGDERHGISMAGMTHFYLHEIYHTQYNFGLGLNSFVIDASGDVNTHAQFEILAGEIADEDLFHTISAIGPTVGMPIYYLSGAGAALRTKTQAGYSVMTDVTAGVGVTGRLVYNQYTGGAWQLTTVSSGDYVLCHVFATNDATRQCIAFVGQAKYATVSAARLGASTEIMNLASGGINLSEYKAVGTVIFQTATAYSNAVKARTRTTDTGENYVDWRTITIAPMSVTGVPEAPVDGLLYVRKNAAWTESIVSTNGSLTGTGTVANPLSASSGATTVTAGGTTTLTVASYTMQEFTGTTTQTVVLPVVTTLRLGHRFYIVNNSTGAITVNSSGGNLVATVAAGNTLIVYCILLTGTTAASWDANYMVQPTEYTGTGTGNLVRASSPTIVTPTVASFANANHNHQDAAGGGALTGLATQTFSVAAATAVDHAVRADQIQSNALGAYTTGGTSTAFTLTTLGTPIALTTNERWTITFNATSGATPTLNRDSKGAKALKYYDSAGAKQACGATTIIANMISDVIYDGTDYIVLDILSPIDDAITDAVTTRAPSQNVVYDALAGKQPLDSDLTTIAGLSPSDDDVIQRKSGAWINRTMAQLLSDLNIVPGTFTPTGTIVANIDTGGITIYAAQYARIGSFVIWSGLVDVNPTTLDAATQFRLTLPVASNFSGSIQLAGVIGASAVVESGLLVADSANDAALVGFIAKTTANHTMSYLIGYQVL